MTGYGVPARTSAAAARPPFARHQLCTTLHEHAPRSTDADFRCAQVARDPNSTSVEITWNFHAASMTALSKRDVVHP